MITDPSALAALICGVTALGFWLEGRFHWARSVGASLLIIFFGAVVSNLDLVTAKSPVYDVIFGPVTSLAIVWLLLAVDLRELKAAGPRMLLAFGVAVLATCAGAVSAAALIGDAFPDDRWRLAGVMTGTYAGGGLNFVAVGREVALPDSLFAAATASDNVMTAIWIGATLMLPLWLRRFYPARKHPKSETDGSAPQQTANPFLAQVLLKPVDLLALLTLGFGLILAADTLSDRAGGPAVLWLTTLALIAAQIPVVRSLSGSMQLGLVALNLFFVVIGIGSRVAEILEVGLEIFYFTAIVVIVHGILTYGLCHLLRLDVETTSVASQAAVGGPSTAIALAAARGWRELALPGALVGLLGYAVGSYAGLAIAAWVRSWG
ncbi:MAG: DUF819 family protein [Thermoanaerobaculia bacterium]